MGVAFGQWDKYFDRLRYMMSGFRENASNAGSQCEETDRPAENSVKEDLNRLCLKCMSFTMSDGVCRHCGARVGEWRNPEQALQPGFILSGQYVVGGVLGQGGFGITYSGFDLKSGRKVAIKEFFPSTMALRLSGTQAVSAGKKEADFEYGLNRFYEEAQLIYRYRKHPNIIHVSKMFRENHTAYYAMEYLVGEDLAHYRRRCGGRIPYEQLLLLILPVMDALECMHKDYVIHRDISPDNIFLGNTVKLIDFGAARISTAGKSSSLDIVLKRGYAPEEQYRTRGRQGPWTDIYAMGSTIYSCLTGQLPPEAPDRLMNDRIVDIRDFDLEIPEYSCAALMRALAVRAEERFHTISEFRESFLGKPTSKRMSECPIDLFRLYGMRGYYAGQSLAEQETLTVGRDSRRCHLIFPQDAAGVSRLHATIWLDYQQNQVWIRDENATCGTFINGRRMKSGEERQLECGDRVSFGGEQEFEIEF